MIKLILSLLLFVGLYGQDTNDDISDNIQPLLVEELSDLELMLIANINTNETLEKFFKLDVINESIKLNAPEYDRFAQKNNTGMFFPVNTSTSLYLDAGLPGWVEASKYISSNNDSYSSGFFNSSLDKFTYYNSRKGFLDTDNYFKDPWDQRSLDDYIRYIHMPPMINHSEINTIYDRNR